MINFYDDGFYRNIMNYHFIINGIIFGGAIPDILGEMSNMDKKKDLKVVDRLWLWGHPAGSHNNQYGLVGESHITPAEAADYMGIRNVMMVHYGADPKPPFDKWSKPLAKFDRVVWSIEGGGGEDVDAALELANTLPNLQGLLMDDYFGRVPHQAENVPTDTTENFAESGAFSLKALQQLRGRLNNIKKPLDLWVVLYTHEFEMANLRSHLDLCDVVMMWTWVANNLVNLEKNFARLEELAANNRKILGLYMYDYGAGKPMPVDLMELQCETGLRWLKEGRIDGMIFLASCISDLGLDAVEWSKRWIAKVGEQQI